LNVRLFRANEFLECKHSLPQNIINRDGRIVAVVLKFDANFHEGERRRRKIDNSRLHSQKLAAIRIVDASD
jgi:hypothetical protein